MTTKVTIEAGTHPVKVNGLLPDTNELVSSFCGGVIQPGQSWDFYAHSAMDLRIHEMEVAEAGNTAQDTLSGLDSATIVNHMAERKSINDEVDRIMSHQGVRPPSKKFSL